MIWTLKCVACIDKRVANMPITSSEILRTVYQAAVDGANLAVTVTDGKALCADCLGAHNLNVVRLGR